MAEKQIKSKERVAEHGEVFTSDKEVNAMLDLVKDETERIDSTFLEPACGEGAFLIKILERKMNIVKKKYGNNEHDYEKYAVLALTSLYGVDLMSDNAQICRNRLFEYWDKQYTRNCKSIANDSVREAARFILEKNILVGNALTLKMVDDKQNDLDEPIIFAEWTLVTGTKMKRRNFRMDVMLEAEDDFAKLKSGEKYSISYSLFDDDVDRARKIDYYEHDPVTNEIIPTPLKEYKLVNYWEVQNNE